MEKILIEENAGEIERLRAKAQHNVATLNRAHEHARFSNFEELQRLVNDSRKYTETELRKDKLTAQLMDRGIKVTTSFELIDRASALTEALESFEFARYNGREFEIDPEALAQAEAKFRKFVESPFQRKVWDSQEALLKVYNGEFDFLGENARLRNFKDNEFISFNRRTGQWERNKWLLIHANEGDFKY